MRSSLTVYLPNTEGFQFSVQCTTYCGQEKFTHNRTYKVASRLWLSIIISCVDQWWAASTFSNSLHACMHAWCITYINNIILDFYDRVETPTAPRNIKNHTTNCNDSSVFFTWDPPENIDQTLFHHYEYIFYLDNILHKTIDPVSYPYSGMQPNYRFRVYAVDKCGQSCYEEQNDIPSTSSMPPQTDRDDCDCDMLGTYCHNNI